MLLEAGAGVSDIRVLLRGAGLLVSDGRRFVVAFPSLEAPVDCGGCCADGPAVDEPLVLGLGVAAGSAGLVPCAAARPIEPMNAAAAVNARIGVAFMFESPEVG